MPNPELPTLALDALASVTGGSAKSDQAALTTALNGIKSSLSSIKSDAGSASPMDSMMPMMMMMMMGGGGGGGGAPAPAPAPAAAPVAAPVTCACKC